MASQVEGIVEVNPQAANDVVPPQGKGWGEMAGRERLVFLGKLVVFICTTGFVYPHLLSE